MKQNLKRTCMCAELSAKDENKNVTLMGWVNGRRNLGSLLFVVLRDRTGIVQATFNEETDKALFDKANEVRSEYVVAVKGTVKKRDDYNINPNMKTGEIEVIAEDIVILNESETPPFEIIDDLNVREENKMKYRYLDLRRPSMQKNIQLRHKITKSARDYFDRNGFLEIETPMLIKSTPEGARDYLVPSRVHPGKFYALPQSPQMYKQLLMLSGMDRYMQIVKCFRDEDLRADRQPEFTQIDLEMSFVDIDDVIAVNEGFLKTVFKEVLDVDIQTPFLRMTYAEAMERFGSDKPDTRFGYELCDLSGAVKNCGFKVFAGAVENGGSVRCINIKGKKDNFTRKEIDNLTEFVKTYRAKGLAWMAFEENEVRSPIAKFLTAEELDQIKQIAGAEIGDILFIVADKNEVVFDALGALRVEIAKRLGILDKNQYNFLWVTEFPLLEYDEEEGRFAAKHHPFTLPMEEDMHLLDTEPGKVRANAYDIILNGSEIGGGSLRIYKSELQKKMFEVLNISPEQAELRFGFLLEAFKYGAPPHAGLAYGLDRLVMIMGGCDSIREVMAFPKMQNASELMSNAPDVVDEKQLRELSLKLDLQKKE